MSSDVAVDMLRVLLQIYIYIETGIYNIYIYVSSDVVFDKLRVLLQPGSEHACVRNVCHLLANAGGKRGWIAGLTCGAPLCCVLLSPSRAPFFLLLMA